MTTAIHCMLGFQRLVCPPSSRACTNSAAKHIAHLPRFSHSHNYQPTWLMSCTGFLLLLAFGTKYCSWLHELRMILLRNISFTRCENMYPASLPALSDLLITSASSPDSGVYAGIRDGGFRVSKKISFFRNDVCLLPQKSFFFHPQKFPMTFLLLVIDSNLRNSTLFHYFFFHKCVYYFTSSLIIPLFIILNEFLFALYLP